MSLTRRGFVQAAAWGVGIAGGVVATRGSRLRVLVLGGTRFVGRHITEAVLARGHVVSLFNRGRTGPGLFPGVEELIGDRENDLSALRGRSWDVLIDTSGVEPRWVRRSSELLHAAVSRCVYVSSTAAYAKGGGLRRSEDSPIFTASTDEAKRYGEKKAASEREVLRCFAGRATIVRPADLFGPHDYDRRHGFVRWPVRARAGGEMLVAGGPEDTVAFTDARDLATWVAKLVEGEVRGAFNVAGPPFTLAALVDAAITVGGPVTPVWVTREWLASEGIDRDELPVGAASSYAMGSALAVVRGLGFRPLVATMADTLAWWDAEGGDAGGWTRAAEQAAIAAWRAGPGAASARAF